MVDFKKLREKEVKSFEEMSVKDRRNALMKQLHPTAEFDNLGETDLKLLSIIGYTEPSTFFELCDGLRRPDINMCPAKGDKASWAGLFINLRALADDGLLIVKTVNKRMESFQLTDAGADIVRDFADGRRPILEAIEEDERESDPYSWEESVRKDRPF